LGNSLMQCGKINMMKRLALSPRNVVNFYAHQFDSDQCTLSCRRSGLTLAF